MIAKILTTIVFIAELIITYSTIKTLYKFDKAILETNSTLNSAKGSIRDIAILCFKISQQFIELTESCIQRFKKKQEDAALNKLNKLFIAIILWKLNIKFINKFRKSNTGKILAKSFSMLQNMV